MQRRDALKTIIGSLTVGAFATPMSLASERDDIIYFGANRPSQVQKRQAARRRLPRFYDRFPVFEGISKATDENVFLWKNLEQELGGPLVPHWQGEDPETGEEGEGDCVAHAGSSGCDILAATNIHMLGANEKFVAEASVEMNYAGSRIEAGGGAIKRRGGSNGEWMARWLKEWGVLHRLEYRDGDNYIDLRGYHPARSRQYRDVGVPDWLESIARQHPVREYTNVQSGAEALDAICARQVVIICSSYAIHDTRDDEGFAMPFLGTTTRGRWGRWFTFRQQWWHAMLLAGQIGGKRRGGVMLNSHGKWNTGPQPHGIPDGGFALEEQYLDMMVKDWGDCYALSSYKGHEAAKILKRIKLY